MVRVRVRVRVRVTGTYGCRLATYYGYRPGSASSSSSTLAPRTRRRHAASDSRSSLTCTAESHTRDPLHVPSVQKAASASAGLRLEGARWGARCEMGCEMDSLGTGWRLEAAP